MKQDGVRDEQCMIIKLYDCETIYDNNNNKILRSILTECIIGFDWCLVKENY